MLLRFDPRLGMINKILSGEKPQTIRKKPIPEGTKLQLWAMWRGMKKGWYCNTCYDFWGNNLRPLGIPKCMSRCQDNSFEWHPKKLMDAICVSCKKIRMKLEYEGRLIEVEESPHGAWAIGSHYQGDLIDFWKKDGFGTNAAAGEFFKKYLTGEWQTFYIISWREWP